VIVLERIRAGDESGDVSLAVLIPSMLVLTFGALNAAWWFHARDIAIASAREGVAQGRVVGADPDAAARTATDFAQRTGRGVLSSVTVDRSGTSTTDVCVQVRASVPLFIPLIPDSHVSQRACSPRERFTP
jgi:hypothetical protein